jgi:hypothetical protein
MDNKMNITDMIEDFMERSFNTVSEVFWINPETLESKRTPENVVAAFKAIDYEWETYEIDIKDWCTGHKLIYQYLGEIMIRQYYDMTMVGTMIKQLGELLYNNRNCESMKLRFEQWKLEQMNKDFE